MAKSIDEIKRQANASAHSRFFFTPDRPGGGWTWNSIFYGETFDAGNDVTLFISSERDTSGRSRRTGEPMAAYGGKRMFTIRISAANGDVDTLGHHMQFRDKRKALRIAEQVATWWRTDQGPEDMDSWVREQ